MSAQVYSLSGQSEVRRKAFLEGANIELSSKLSLPFGGNVNHNKSVHHPVSTVSVGIGNILAVFKTR